MEPIAHSDDVGPTASFVLALDALPRAPPVDHKRSVSKAPRTSDAEAIAPDRLDDVCLPRKCLPVEIEWLQDHFADKPCRPLPALQTDGVTRGAEGKQNAARRFGRHERDASDRPSRCCKAVGLLQLTASHRITDVASPFDSSAHSGAQSALVVAEEPKCDEAGRLGSLRH